ncbi:hypothetical protein AAHS21_23710 [Mycobacterium sp. 050272]|uniref:hypothetical protein n=1 Tax=Mycobacterium sp. 050272 TaxID=3142488 RepID=UPI00318583E3
MAELLIIWVDGRGKLTALALSLIYGVPVDEVDQKYVEWESRGGLAASDWGPQGARRTREAAARVNSYDAVDVLRYWADKELGADVLRIGTGVMLVER